jgi:EpsD family peptidyl-prolyl cis-trans isomerase
VALLSACGEKKDGGASQVAAKVNGHELTVHQLNFRLQQDRNLKPEQLDGASSRLLETLIDQELVVQKSEQQKLDRDPRVVQALDAARREVLARAYVEQLGQSVPAPLDEAIRRYYDSNPQLFAQRRVYSLVEVVAEPNAAQKAEMVQSVKAGKSAETVVAWLQAQGIKHASKAVVLPAESIPLTQIGLIASVPEGQGSMTSTEPVARSIFVKATRLEPVTFEQAKPAITQFLQNDARRKVIEANVQALRTAAKIEYEGKFAERAAAQPKLGTTQGMDVAPSGGVAPETPVSLPATSAGATVKLPAEAPGQGVQVSLPNAPPGAQVSLPAAGLGTQVSLPDAAASAAALKPAKKNP